MFTDNGCRKAPVAISISKLVVLACTVLFNGFWTQMWTVHIYLFTYVIHCSKNNLSFTLMFTVSLPTFSRVLQLLPLLAASSKAWASIKRFSGTSSLVSNSSSLLWIPSCRIPHTILSLSMASSVLPKPQ